jgi:hypothetical protein
MSQPVEVSMSELVEQRDLEENQGNWDNPLDGV